MPARQLPVSPNVQHVKREAKHLLRAYCAGELSALADFREFISKDVNATTAILSDAQLVLARSYGATGFPQLIAAVEFIRACWSNDGNRVRDAVLTHAEILKDYYKTPHDGWREDLRAAAMQGGSVVMKFMRESGAQISNAEARQRHSREWIKLSRVLFKLGNPFTRPPTAPIVIYPSGESLAVVNDHAPMAVPKPKPEITPEDDALWSRLEQRMKMTAQDPTKTNRTFERMRAHNLQFPIEPTALPEHRRKQEWMNECLRLYIQSHPLP